jgi:predicted thioesterase
MKTKETGAQMEVAAAKLAAYFRTEASEAKVAAYLRTAEGRKSTALIKAEHARQEAKIMEQKTRRKMVNRWKATAGAKGSEDA